jgi:DNA (cytosine-5)-methyltransferase 1
MSFGVHRAALDYALGVAASLGYKTEWRVLNAADYGVPQIRQRLFLVGLRDGDFAWPTATHAKTPVDSTPHVMKPWVTAGEAINDLDTEQNADDTGHFAGGKHHELLKQVPPGQNYLFFTKERGHPDPQFKWRSRYWSFLLKLSPDMPSWTIQARRSNNMGPLHWRNRILRIEEVKRLQSFPDDWMLTGTVENQWRQVGNAVPPRLAEQLGLALRRALVTTAP